MFPVYIATTLLTNAFWGLSNVLLVLLSYTQQVIGLPLLTVTSSLSYDLVTSHLLAAQHPALRSKINNVVWFTLDFAALILCAAGIYMTQPKLHILIPKQLKAAIRQIAAVSFFNVWGGIFIAYRLVEQYTPSALAATATRTAFFMHVAHATVFLFALVYSFSRLPYGGLMCMSILACKFMSSFFAVLTDLVEPSIMSAGEAGANGLSEFWCNNAFMVWIYVAGVFWQLAYISWMVGVEARRSKGRRYAKKI